MQTSNTYSISRLDWDSKFFNIESAKITLLEEISENDFEYISNKIKDSNFKFVTIQNINNNEKNNYMIRKFNNIFLADVNVQFIKKTENCLIKNNPIKDIEIKNFMKYNENIINISKESFIYSRFFNDYNLRKGNLIYTEWTKNAFDRKDKYFCYYEKENQILGYLLFSINNQELTIELIAVDKNSKGLGIGSSLINKVEQYAITNKIKYIKVGTQINNISAQNFYISCGFKHITNNSIYHLWL